jgi:hypothetical protein
MEKKRARKSEYPAIVFILTALGLFILGLPRPLLGGVKISESIQPKAGSSVEAQILPRQVTSQPFDFSFSIKVQPNINGLSSFSFLLNELDITFLLIVEALRNPSLVSFTGSDTLTFTFPQISLTDGTYKIELNVTSSTGEKASDSVTYTIGETVPPVTISFVRDIKPIFDNRCALAGCHSGSNPEAGMDLTTPFDPTVGAVGVPSQELPSMLRISPGDSTNSYLTHKIQGTQAEVGGSGSRMPLIGGFLSDEEIQSIITWIDEGAQNN